MPPACRLINSSHMEEGAKEEGGSYFAKSNRWGKTKIEALGEGRHHHVGDQTWSLWRLGWLQPKEISLFESQIQGNKVRSDHLVSKVLTIPSKVLTNTRVPLVLFEYNLACRILGFVQLFKNRSIQVSWKVQGT